VLQEEIKEKQSPRCTAPHKKEISSHLSERIPETWMNENILKSALLLILHDTGEVVMGNLQT